MKTMYSKIILVLVVLLFMGSYLISYRNFKSYIQQVKVNNDLNSASFTDTPSDFYNNLEIDLPSLNITSIPLKAIKAVYIESNEPVDSIQKAIDLFHESRKENPFIMFSEGHLSQLYYSLRKYDSAYYYARKSFKGLPRNAVHFAMISKLYANFNQYDSIIYTFEKIKYPLRADIRKIYFSSAFNFIDKIEDSLKSIIVADALESKSVFLIDKELQLLSDYILEGQERVNQALEFEEIGQFQLSEKLYEQGIDSYNKALEIRKNNLAYIQTIALAHYNLSNFKESIENFEKLENQNIPLDQISLYVKGISHYNLKEYKASCSCLEKSKNFGFEKAKAAFNDLCVQKQYQK